VIAQLTPAAPIVASRHDLFAFSGIDSPPSWRPFGLLRCGSRDHRPHAKSRALLNDHIVVQPLFTGRSPHLDQREV
jgi:hypothetical protein